MLSSGADQRGLGEQFPQPAPAAMQPGHHGADRAAHDVGDLPVSEALNIGQVDSEPEIVGELVERVGQAGIREALKREILR